MNQIFLHQHQLMKGALAASSVWGLRIFMNPEDKEILSLKLSKAIFNYGVLDMKSKHNFAFTGLTAEVNCLTAMLHCRTTALYPLGEAFNCLFTTIECQGPVNTHPTAHIVQSSEDMGILHHRPNEVTNPPNTVVLHDMHISTESVIHRGCHIAFSWTIFATLWSSVVAFPVVTVLKVVNGAWNAVLSIVGLWAAALLIRLPSSDETRRFLFRGLHKWFPYVDIVYEEEPQVTNTIFCCHPHGAFSIGAAILLDDLNYRKLPDGSTRDVAIVAAPFLRWCNPLFKWLTDLTGIQIHGAGRREFRKLLETGESCALVPGGFSEATITCVGKERIYINGRKGFIKYALRAGYSVTPVYAFGESDLYHNPQGLWEFRLFLNTLRFQIPGVVPFGYPLAPLAPRRMPIRIVCGPALHLPLISNPTDADVDFYHAKYVAAVEELYYRNVNRYHEEVYSKYIAIGENEGPRALEKCFSRDHRSSSRSSRSSFQRNSQYEL